MQSLFFLLQMCRRHHRRKLYFYQILTYISNRLIHFVLLRKKLLSKEILVQSIYRGPRGILCTRGEKEHTSKRVSIIAPDNAISEAKCATCTRLRRRTLRCTLHYASKLARSRCKANLSFSAKKTRRLSRVFCRQKRDYGNCIKYIRRK